METVTAPQDRLHDIIYRGVGPDIYLAERARELHRAVAEFAGPINRARYGNFFREIQNAAVGELVLIASRIFERSSAQYQVRSIPAAIDILAKNSPELVLVEPAASLVAFERAGIETRAFEGLDGEEFTRSLAATMSASCPRPDEKSASELSRSLHSLRANRDKTIAHNEAFDRESLPSASWHQLQQLLEYAKGAIGGLAMAYFGAAFFSEQGYHVAGADTEAASRELHRLLCAAGVIPPSVVRPSDVHAG
jgi:hypothetical protein